MSNAACALPAGPGGRDAEIFPLEERARFRDRLGLALIELRARCAAFRALAKGPWAVFVAIACHWQSNAEAWPSQEALARFTGWSTRAVRDHVAALVLGGFVRLRREHRADGGERIFYAPGLMLLGALAEFVGRYPREVPRVLREAASVAAEPVAEGGPEAAAEELLLEEIKPSSCEGAATAPAPIAASNAPKEEEVRPSEEDEEIAREALAERWRRKFPGRAAPRWFDAGELAIVAARTRAIEGDRDEKLAAHRAALDGAFALSKDRPPTVRFVWGRYEHFVDHVERGRRAARARAARAAPLVKAKPIEPRETLSVEQMRADIARIFGSV